MYIYILAITTQAFSFHVFQNGTSKVPKASLRRNDAPEVSSTPRAKAWRISEWAENVPGFSREKHIGQPMDIPVELSLLVGGWATPLKNMNVNWDDEIPYYSQYMGK